MLFILLTIVLLLVGVAIMFALARAFEHRGVADLLDWKPTRSYEAEAQLEMDDIQQMIEAQNQYRRRRGAADITEADVRAQAAEDDVVRARGRGAFSQQTELAADTEGLDPKLVEAALAPPKKRKPKAQPKKRPR